MLEIGPKGEKKQFTKYIKQRDAFLKEILTKN